jgi:molybdate transport system regulatory protein
MGRAQIDLKPRLIARGERALGPGKADLLEHIASLGSISAAAKAMEMSYARAWALVDTMNRAFKQPIVEAATGGQGGGGARLTDFGAEVLTRYRTMQATLDECAAKHLKTFEAFLK